jgi:hypothetical protein
MTEAVTSISANVAQAADAMQAAYFRAVLIEHRAQLDVAITKVQSQIEAREQAGARLDARRLRRQMRGYFCEHVQVDWLISGLDRRYSPELADSTVEIG